MQPMQCSMMGINPSALGITPTGYPHFDPLTWAMASNTMKGPFMQFLPGPPVMPRGGSTYGSPIASAPTDSCRNSMKSTRRENDTEVSSKSKRHKENSSKKVGKGGNGNGRGVPNKKWGEEKDDFLIPFLANQARMRRKVDKGFRKEAFNAAATALNEKFNKSFSGEHVYNHYRNLKTRYQDMLKCFEISGAGWDEETKYYNCIKNNI
ncbi:uncharacterized protein LOC109850760 [Asparagus officinalis]|uniref:uncharacterized protein LOC109850760 n=1 Tax=Asparagus officinalis TaxID=4686 RepID=UPI00098E7175|nr:uncharacterized protein LOC109850760 [Asparagus officinalis]